MQLPSTNSSPFDNFYRELLEKRSWFIIFQAIIGLITCTGASIVLFLFYLTRKKFNSASMTSARKFFIALATADFQSGIILTPVLMNAAATGLRVNDNFCVESICLVSYTLLVTLFLLVTMTCDRYLAIFYPLKHRVHSKSGVTCFVIVACYILGGILAFLCYLSRNLESPHPEVICFVSYERISDSYSQPVILFVVFPSIFVFVVAYVRIFKAIRTSTKTVPKSMKNAEKIIIRRNTRKILTGISAREVRATLILFLTILLFLLVWIPAPVGFIIYRYFPSYGSLNLGIAVLLCMQLNSMINPFLYARNIKNSRKLLMDCVVKRSFVPQI
ncbi:type-1 angiotensin II receptor A-like [Culicoides brevitarsis]|uniref:type-1 angiotensin II receptor A-like n=1 Tax=Culicoides brevitarsis TaxID=469753 RepID=UPI00307C0B4B